MRKLFICWICCLMGFISSSSLAQIQFESSTQHGQILDVTYSPNTANQIFARTVNNHIVKSDDMGQTWRILHSVPQENNFIIIKDLKISADGNFLTYICVAEGTALNRVEVFNLQTGTVEHQIISPLGAVEGSLIHSYSIAKNNYNSILLHTTKMVNWGLVTEVFYSSNGGGNWTSVYFSPENGDIHLNNVAISPHNAQKMYLMRGASPNGVEGGLLVSDDAGENWEEQINGLNFSAIAFHPTNANTIYLGSFYLGINQTQTLFRTTNGGMSWVELPIEWTSMSTNSIHAIVFNPNDLDNLVVLEENEIAITHDNGVNWETYVYNDQDYDQYFYGLSASFNPFNENQLLISANYYPFISNDGGVTLEKFQTPFVNGTHRMSLYNGENQHVYYGLRGGFIHKNVETEIETEVGFLPLGFISNNSFSGVFTDAHKEGRVFMSNMSMMGSSTIFVSDEHGANPVSIHTDSYILITAMETMPSNSNHVLMSFGESLYKFDLTDFGNVVSQNITTPIFGYVESMIFGANENEFSIAIQNKVFHTTNNGQNWIEISTGLEPITSDDFIYDLTQNPLNTNQWALATSVGVFTTENAGQNWTYSYQESLINKVEFSPFENGVIMGTSRFEDGSFYPSSHSEIVFTKNAGATWEVISIEELGFLRTMNSDIMFLDNQTADAYFHVSDFGLIKYNVDVSTETQGVSDVSKAAFVLYPNPTSQTLNLKTDLNIESIIIHNSVGQKITQTKMKTIDVSHLSSGIYFVSILDSNQYLHTQKFIKQ